MPSATARVRLAWRGWLAVGTSSWTAVYARAARRGSLGGKVNAQQAAVCTALQPHRITSLRPATALPLQLQAPRSWARCCP